MSTGPVASSLVLLSDLESCKPGTKVRFLGCVDEYVTKTATLKLKHNFPVETTPKFAYVSVDHVLETVKHDTMDIGAWLNIIGYIERSKTNRVYVQAVTIWDAGNINLEAYQKAVEARKDAG
ncbi:CST complex subunit Ten1 [Dendryphion nanum]|uniref:CST complex subunit Ten1 n=1 Tax=Dendryphion nanum TaxID=256645 RepID=A0A9P9E439_9PLEO|nr:CST complex subunit Ten1 [Dendryphion nanum]